MSDRLRFSLLLACFLLSGAAGLIYETAWTEELTLVFGASEPAVAAVLAAYMAGLALGAALAGRWQHRVRRPVLLYAWIEFAIGASALAVPVGLTATRRLQTMLLGGRESLPEGGGVEPTLFYLAASFVILLVPTTLMGATLPLLVRHAVRRDRQIGARPALLYAVNTVGAAAGVLAAAFVLLPALALQSTVYVGVAVNVLVFALATALAAGARPSEAVEASPAAPRGRFWILPAILVSGAVSFTWEILWVRLLTHVLGGSIFAFGAMLATFLAGIALGSAAAARLATDPGRARAGFAWAQVAAAAFSLTAFAVVDRLPDLARHLAVGASSLPGGVALSAATLLPSALAMGATFPFAVRVLTGAAGETAAASARIYAWNTVGAILGAIGGGFVVLPALGMAGAAAAATAASLLLAMIAGLVRPRLAAPAVAAAGVLVLLAVWPPATPWRLLRHSVLQTVEDSGRPAGGEIIYHGVGRSATVMLTEQAGEWRLTANGLPESVIQPPGARPGRYQITRWLSLLPTAVRPATRTMMVVGLGAGNTVEYLPAGLESVSVVELEPEVVAANRFVAARRAVDPLANARVELHVNDARGAMTLTERRFDAIVSQPSHPWTAGAAHLFTHEFFSLARERLNPEGVFLQWIGLAFVDEDLLRTLVATLGDVFAHVEVYRPTAGALLFMGSDAPLAPEATAARAVAGSRPAWGVVGVLDGGEVVAARVLDDAGARAFANGAALNTDRRNLLRTRSPRILRRAMDPRRLDEILAPHDPLLRRPGRRPLFTMRQLLRRGQSARAGRLAGSLPNAADRDTARALTELAAGRPRVAERSLRRVLAIHPGHHEALAALTHLRRAAIAVGRAPELARLAASDPAAAILEGWTLVSSGDWERVRALEPRLATVRSTDPFYGAAVNLRVEWRRRAGEPELAAEAVRLIDPLLVPAPQPGNLLVRADLGRLAGSPTTALASLAELLLRPLDPPVRQAAGQIFAALPESAESDPRHRWVAERLR